MYDAEVAAQNLAVIYMFWNWGKNKFYLQLVLFPLKGL